MENVNNTTMTVAELIEVFRKLNFLGYFRSYDFGDGKPPVIIMDGIRKEHLVCPEGYHVVGRRLLDSGNRECCGFWTEEEWFYAFTA